MVLIENVRLWYIFDRTVHGKEPLMSRQGTIEASMDLGAIIRRHPGRGIKNDSAHARKQGRSRVKQSQDENGVDRTQNHHRPVISAAV